MYIVVNISAQCSRHQTIAGVTAYLRVLTLTHTLSHFPLDTIVPTLG